MDKFTRSSIQRELVRFCKIGPRWAGTKGETGAADYIKGKFRKAGLKVSEEQFEYLAYQPLSYSLEVEPGQVEIQCRPLTYSANTPRQGVTGEIIYTGGGDESDYKRLRSSGVRFHEKIVVAETVRSYLSYPVAEKYGAAGFVLVTNTPGSVIRIGTASMGRAGSIPAVSVSFEDGRFLQSLVLSSHFELKMNVKASFQTKRSRNIVGSLSGRKSNRKFVVTSHYDSYWLGPHAFDNASGVVGLIELARAIAREHLEVAVDFAAVGVEEHGSFGARSYVEHRSEALPELCLNIDSMFGSGKYSEPEVQYSPKCAGIVHDAISESGIHCKNWRTLPSPMLSDHVPFVQKKVPSIWLGSTLPPYYHTEKDTPDIIDTKRMQDGILLALNIIKRAAKKSLRRNPVRV